MLSNLRKRETGLLGRVDSMTSPHIGQAYDRLNGGMCVVWRHFLEGGAEPFLSLFVNLGGEHIRGDCKF